MEQRMSQEPVLIIDGARTPMGGLLGSLSSVPAPELASTAVREALKRSAVNGAAVDEIFMGCVLPAGLKQCPARQAAIGADIPTSTGAVTGTNQVVVAGGMESMSNAPHLMPRARAGVRLGPANLYDHMFMDGLEDAYTGRAMGTFAQETADERGLGREAMDAFAIESLNRARGAIDSGALTAETAPVTVTTRKGTTVVQDDEQPHKAAVDKIPGLRPAFSQDGTITAANSSSISDGASALVLMSGSEAERQGIDGMATLVAHSRHSRDPGDFTLAPIGAIEKLLAKTGWSAAEVDLFEINEAFAMVTMLAMQDLGLDHGKVNIHGGACAQGHPIGSTGSRIIVSLLYALRQTGGKRGIAALCIGGGEATAVAVELR
jgi:acetyl-CoA C-acetyltransferase